MIREVQFKFDIEPLWRDAQEYSRYQYPFLSFRWHQAWRTSFATKPLIFVDETHHILIALEIAQDTAYFSGGEEIADYLDAIGPENGKVQAWRETIDLLRERHIRLLRLRNIPEHSETLQYFGTVRGATIGKEDTTPCVALPSTFDAYLASLARKERHELRRKMRKFEQTYSGVALGVTIGAQTDIHTLLRLMKLDFDKQKFLSPQMEHFFLALPATIGEGLVQLRLSIGDTAIATLIGFRSDTEFLLYNSGYDRAYDGAGLYLKAKTLSWAIDQHLAGVNFLQGNERYKYDLGGKDQFVYAVEAPL